MVAPGLMVASIILFMGAVSGAHLNPAVSLAFAVRGDFPWKRMAGYIVSQMIGATLACLFLLAVFGNVEHLGATLPGPGYADWQALLMEIVLTAGLVSVILGTASGAQNVGTIGALGVGGYIALAGLWSAPVSGTSMNPVRSFGPALVSGDWTAYWVYVARPAARRGDRRRLRDRAARSGRRPDLACRRVRHARPRGRGEVGCPAAVRPTKGLDMRLRARTATRLAATAMLFVGLLAMPAVAGAASVAYVDKGEVWLSSLDGAQKARLAGPVVNASGETEEWLDVAQSDGGRIVAVRNKPGRISNFSWFKIWEPDGTSTVEGPLNAPSGWSVYVYPLGFDITADGSHLVYGYSNSSGCCPISFARGTYVRPATNSVLNPINTSGQTSPSLLGSRVIALQDASSPTIVDVQNADGGNPYTSAFSPWLDTSGVGLNLEGVDVAADGRLAALGFQAYNGSTQTVGKIALLAIQGVESAAHVPGGGGLLPARGRHRQGPVARPGRRRDRVEGRRRREGRRHSLDHGRPLRDGKRARRDLRDRHAPVDRPRRRRRVPARVVELDRDAGGRRGSGNGRYARHARSDRHAGRSCCERPGAHAPEDADREGAGDHARRAGHRQGRRPREGLRLRHRPGEASWAPREAGRRGHRHGHRADRRDGDAPAATQRPRPQARPPAQGRATQPAHRAGLAQHDEGRDAALTDT